MNATATHKHEAQRTTEEGYSGPVAREENRAAHGNVCVVEHCECGFERRANVNQAHVEQGSWRPSRELELRWADRQASRDAEAERRSHMLDRLAWLASNLDGSDVSRVDEGGAWCRGTYVRWRILREAAAQRDPGLREAYQDMLADALALDFLRRARQVREQSLSDLTVGMVRGVAR